MNRQLLNFIDVYEHNGPGWVFSKFVSLQLSLWHLDPLRTSAFVPLPSKQNMLITTIFPLYIFLFLFLLLVLSRHRITSINVYGVDDKKVIYPLRVSSTLVPDRHVDLLLLERNGIQHYTTITNVSRLVSSEMSYHGHTVYCCKQCLHIYSTQELLDAHAADCCHVQRTKFPDDPRCRFANIQKQLPAPFVVYADFELILKPVDKDVDTTQCVEVGGESSYHVFQEDIQRSFAYKVVSNVDPNFSRPLVMYRAENAAEKCVRDLQQEAKQLFNEYIPTPKPKLHNCDRLTCSHICTKPFGDDKVRDDCHIVGIYRGAAHSECNLMYRISKPGLKLPVVIHNLEVYDGHLFVKALKSDRGSIEIYRLFPIHS